MSRNKSFHPSREPFQQQDAVLLHDHHLGGPFSFLNPTRAHFRHTALPSKQTSSTTGSDEEKAEPTKDEQFASDIEFKWRSRDNRKGRHALVVQASTVTSGRYITPRPTNALREVAKGMLCITTQYPYWDVSWLVATIFTLGSVVWVINSFFAYLPLAQPSTEFNNESLYAGGITAFIGATVFEIGSVFLMLEAMNENRSGCFGWAFEKLIEGQEGGTIRVRPDKGSCSHHHNNKRNLLGKSDGESINMRNWGHIWLQEGTTTRRPSGSQTPKVVQSPSRVSNRKQSMTSAHPCMSFHSY